MCPSAYPACLQCGSELTGRQTKFCTRTCWGRYTAAHRPPTPLKPCGGCGERKPKHKGGSGKHRGGLCTECYRAKLDRPTYGERRPGRSTGGYLRRWNPRHPEAHGGLVLVHREVYFDHNGSIPEGHDIHHINGDRLDNRIENLEAVSASEHASRHVQERGFVKNQYGTWPLRAK